MSDYRGTELTGVTVLKGTCSVCPARADYRVTRANTHPPKGYIKGGTISTDYCVDHVPADALTLVINYISL